MLDLVVELLRHLRVDALERFVLGHRLCLVVDGVVSERKIEVSLRQVWSQLDHLLVRIDRFRVATCVVKREPEIKMSGHIRRLNLRRLLQRVSRLVVFLQTVVSVAEILVCVRTDLVSFLKSNRVRLARLAGK